MNQTSSSTLPSAVTDVRRVALGSPTTARDARLAVAARVVGGDPERAVPVAAFNSAI